MSVELIFFWGAVIVLGGFLLGGTYVVTRPKPEFAGHPKGLFLLFMAEMWERFSYYGMRALLMFYLVQHWLFSESEAGVIYGAYTALVYITPVVGGYLADRYLGQRKAVLFGAVLLTFGHFFMAFEGNGGQTDPGINIFWLALALIIVGSGFLKANISVIVGQLYARTDVRRDGAYTIFYMGINVGAATASLICGYLGQTYGWGYGFGLAGVGMLIGLIFFVLGKPLLMGQGEPRDPVALRKRVGGISREWLFYGVGLVMVALAWAMIQYQDAVGVLLGAFGAVLVSYVLFIATFALPYGGYKQAPAGAANAFLLSGAVLTVAMTLTAMSVPGARWVALGGGVALIGVIVQQCLARKDEVRDRILAAMFMITMSIVFWALFEQAGSSLNLFTDNHVDRGDIPASMFQSINAIYIILLAPLFAGIWTGLGRRGREPSAPFKFGLGIVQVGLGFLVLVWGANTVGPEVATPVIFIFLIYLLHTTGELCLSPVGLSAMNRLAPRHMASLIMGMWFFASATGNFAAGLIASATGAEEVGETASKDTVLGVYSTVGWVAMGIGLAVLFISPLIKRLMHLNTLKDDEDVAGQAELAEPAAAGIHPGTAPTKPGLDKA